MWTTPEDLEETLKWYRKHETQVIEVLVSATKGERPRMWPKGEPSPILREHEMCLVGRRGCPGIHGDVMLSSILTKVPTTDPVKNWFHIWIETVIPGGRYLHLFGTRAHLRNGWVTAGPGLFPEVNGITPDECVPLMKQESAQFESQEGGETRLGSSR